MLSNIIIIFNDGDDTYICMTFYLSIDNHQIGSFRVINGQKLHLPDLNILTFV